MSFFFIKPAKYELVKLCCCHQAPTKPRVVESRSEDAGALFAFSLDREDWFPVASFRSLAVMLDL